jgi:hypothetical protein
VTHALALVLLRWWLQWRRYRYCPHANPTLPTAWPCPQFPFSPAAHCVVTFNRKSKKMKPVTLTDVQIGSVDLFEDDFDTYDIVPVSVSGREH